MYQLLQAVFVSFFFFFYKQNGLHEQSLITKTVTLLARGHSKCVSVSGGCKPRGTVALLSEGKKGDNAYFI